MQSEWVLQRLLCFCVFDPSDETRVLYFQDNSKRFGPFGDRVQAKRWKNDACATYPLPSSLMYYCFSVNVFAVSTCIKHFEKRKKHPTGSANKALLRCLSKQREWTTQLPTKGSIPSEPRVAKESISQRQGKQVVNDEEHSGAQWSKREPIRWSLFHTHPYFNWHPLRLRRCDTTATLQWLSASASPTNVQACQSNPHLAVLALTRELYIDLRPIPSGQNARRILVLS